MNQSEPRKYIASRALRWSPRSRRQAVVGALARVLTDEVGAELPRHAAPVDGESLDADDDAIDVAVLAALGSR